MVKVRYIPGLFEDRRIEFESHNKSIRAILHSLIKKCPELRNDVIGGITIRVNGKKISPFQWYKINLKDGDRVTIIQETGIDAIGLVWGFIASWGAVTGGLGYGAVAWAAAQVAFWVASTAYTIYSYTKSPKSSRGNLPSNNALDNSPTYGWEGIKMSIDTRIPVPVVYGEHLVGGNLISCHVSTDGEKHYLNILIALSEGEIEGIMKSDLSGVCGSNSDTPFVLINGNPYSNYQGVWWDYRLGTQNQDSINGFSDVKISYNVGPVQITGTGFIYTTTDSDVEAFELKFRVPALYNINAYGNFVGGTIVAKIEHRINGTSDWTNDGNFTVSAATRATIRRYFRQDGLTAAKYDIRVMLTQGDNYEGTPFLDSVVEIKYDNLSYPHTAMLALKVLATDQLSGSIPNVLTRIRGLKVKNLETSATAWSQNPIYCVNNKIVNSRYGLGRFITQANINNDQLIEEAQYSDQMVGDGTQRDIDSIASTSLTDNDYTFNDPADIGKTLCCKSPTDGTVYTNMVITSISGGGHTANGSGGWSGGTPATPGKWEFGEKRYLYDIVIDAQGNGLDLIQTMCSSFRASPIWIKDAIQILIEKKESPSYIFNMGNIIEGSFSHQFGSEKKKPNVIEVQFANKERNFERETREVADRGAIISGIPKRVRSLSLIGATRQSQIYREGRFHLLAAKYQDESILFGGGIDAIHVLPGEVTKFQHDVPQWGYGGRIMASAINSITLDQEVQVEAGFTYRVIVKLPGTGGTETIETRTVANGTGYHTVLNVTSDFSSIPPIWGNYLFGKQDQESKPFRTMKISKNSKNEIVVEATEYSDQVYVDTDIELPMPTYSDLPNPADIPHVTDLEAKEGGIILGDGTWVPFIEIAFRKPETSGLIAWDRAEVYISIDDGLSYEYYGKTDKEHGFKIENHPFLKIGNVMRVKVLSVAKNGTRSRFDTAPYDDEIITGKTGVPEDISNFSVTQLGDKIVFAWENISSKDISHYEIREGPTWAISQIVVERAYGTSYNLFVFTGGWKNYLIKAVDRTGNYSLNPAQYEINVISSSLTNIAQTVNVFDNPTLSDTVLQFGLMGALKAISLIPTQGWDDAGLWDDDSNWDIPVSPTSGYFESESIDFGVKKTWMIVLDDNYIADGDGQTATVQIKTSDNGADWSAYSTFVSGEYNCRYIMLKASLATDNADENIFATKFTIQGGDSKLISIRFSNITIAVGGTTVNYGYTYGSAPAVTVTPVSAGALIPVITSLGTTSCAIKVFDTTDTDVGGTVNIIVEGY